MQEEEEREAGERRRRRRPVSLSSSFLEDKGTEAQGPFGGGGGRGACRLHFKKLKINWSVRQREALRCVRFHTNSEKAKRNGSIPPTLAYAVAWKKKGALGKRGAGLARPSV